MMRLFFFRSHGAQASVRRFFICFGLLLALLGAKDVSAFPVIQTQPVALNVSIGQVAAIFTIVVTQTNSSSPLYVQWRRNGQNISGQLQLVVPVPLVGAVSTLTMLNVQPSDAGSYSAVVFDANGAVSSVSVDLFISNLPAALVNDIFTNRGALSSLFSGSVGANNFIATKEPGEPNIGGRPGGASVWLKWFAPTNGVARFDTRGSDFDTTLGVYTRADARFPYSVTNLALVEGDDDAGNYFNSSEAFNATANTEYEIAIDGFYGVQGNIVLNWSLEQTSEQVPIILTQPINITVTSNASLTLSIVVNTNNAAGLPFCEWSWNGHTLLQGLDTSLEIPAITATNVGLYRVLVSFTRQSSTNSITLSQPMNVQIDVGGNTNAVASAKFRDETDTSSGPPAVIIAPGVHPRAVPVSGFTGTHIWNTYGAESEPGEPNHCGVVGGAPYWFAYQSPANGALTVDAYTPTFTNVLAIYTGPGDSFDTLKTYACASTNSGVGHEVAAFPVANGTVYWIVVDGLNGAVGNVTLNYNLTVPPAITAQPQSQTVSQGSNVTLTVAATGTPVPSYQWRTNTINFPGQISGSLTVSNFQSAKAGNYDVVVANTAGSVTSSVATLYLNSPARFGNFGITATGGFTATLLGAANTNYVIQASSNLVNWIPIATNKSPYGVISVTDTNGQNYPGRFYRAISQ